MTTKDFMVIVKKRFETCTILMMGSKDKEYNRNNNKFHNFYRASSIANSTPEKALLGMWMKHIVSILDMVDDIENDKYVYDQGTLNEKMNDNHNYLFLLEGMICERFKKD